MSFAIEWTGPATRDLRRLDSRIAARVYAAVTRLATTGQGNVTQLTGVRPPEWRLRVGDQRVRYELDQVPAEAGKPPVDVLRVLRVLHRREAYRDV